MQVRQGQSSRDSLSTTSGKRISKRDPLPRRDGVVGLIETLEQLADLLLTDADTGVGDDEKQKGFFT